MAANENEVDIDQVRRWSQYECELAEFEDFIVGLENPV
jgi:hypothetical protein